MLESLGKKNKVWIWENGNKEKKEEISMLNLWDQIFDDGVEQGIEQGIERVNTLNCHLIKEKRYDDLERASKDPEYRKALFKLYGIGPQKHENRKRIVTWREIED